MRLTPVTATLWAQWRRTRWTLLVLFVLLPAFAAAIHALHLYGAAYFENAPSQDFMIAFAFIGAASLFAMGVVLLIHSDADSLGVALPVRMLRLPIATWALVAAAMGYGAVFVGAVSLFAAVLMRLVFPDTAALWWMPAAAVCAIAALQAWAFAQRDIDPRRAAVLGVLCAAPIAWLVRRQGLFTLLRDGGWATQGAIVLAVLAVFYLAGVAGVALNRKGGFREWVNPERFRVFRRTRKRHAKSPFRSPFKAQLWYEWRLFGWHLPVAIVIALALYFLAMPLLVGVFRMAGVEGDASADLASELFNVEWYTSAQFVTTGFQIAALVGAVIVGGILFMRVDVWNLRSSFLLTRPTTTQALVHARVVTALKSALLALGILMAGMGALVLYLEWRGLPVGILHYLEQGYPTMPQPAVMGYFWLTLFVLMWVALWPVNVGWAMLVLLIGHLPMLAKTGLQTLQGVEYNPLAHREADPLQQYGTWAAAAVIIAVVVWAAQRAIRMRLVTTRAVLLAIAAWCVYSIYFIVYESAFSVTERSRIPTDRFPHPIDWFLWAALSLLPIAPIFIHPLYIQRARHQ